MEFLNLKEEYSDLKEEIDASVSRVLESGCFIGGEEVEKLENELSVYLGVKYVVTVNSGTDALILALKSIDVRDYEVITTPFTFMATANAIVLAGGKPVFADINENDFNINVDKIKEKITDKTKVILPVHLFGNPCNMEEINKLSDKNLKIVEDCAQAFGTKALDKKVENKVDNVKCFSFYPTKNLGCYGDGGAIATNSDELYNKIKLLKNHGASDKDRYNSQIIGTNSRLDSIQASILRIKLKYVDRLIEKRRENAKYYCDNLKQEFFPESTYNQYTIRIKDRDKLKVDFPYQIYYPKPLHLMKAFGLEYKNGNFPVSEKASKEVISLPLLINRKQQDYVIRQIQNYI